MKKCLLLLICGFMFTQNATAYRTETVERASHASSIRLAAESVVSLYASRTIARIEDNMDAAFTDEFIGEISPEINTKNQNSLGSGVIVDSSGMVITNSHIVDGAIDIKVVAANNKEYKATVIAVDKSLDLAILQMHTEDKFTKIEFSDSDNVYVGDTVFAIGNPFGIGQSVSMGIVSAMGRSNFNIEHAQHLIQTDAAINPGNSGGALIDVDGRLVGLNSAIFSRTEAFSGVGFAVPSNAVKFAIDSLKASGNIQKAWLGAKGEDITKDMQRRLGLKNKDGVYINQVFANSPAEYAGIKAGDILISLGGKKVINNYDLKALTPSLPINKRIDVVVQRHGRVMSLEAELRPIEKRIESDKFIIRGNNVLSGIVVEKLSAELNYMLNLPLDNQGIAVIDRPNTVNNLNLQVGDIILDINNNAITSLEDLQKVLAAPAPFGWNFSLLRSGKNIKIFVK
jgi:serine protease Do